MPASMNRYRVSLERFTFQGHVDPQGGVHLHWQEGTRQQTCNTLVVEAESEEGAKAAFQKALGIGHSTQKFSVKQVG